MAVSLDQFTQSVVDSSLMSVEDVAAAVASVRAEQRPADGEQLARLLVKLKKLSSFQAQQLYAGKGKSLVLGNYLILDKLGQGGMGMVLKARHRRMNRVVALKVLSPTVTKTPEAMKRFQREVEAAAQLQHPNIVTAYDADEVKETHYLVMEFVEGTDLSALVHSKGPLSVQQAVAYVLQAARGLEYAHTRGVVHRDIKPANLLLDQSGTVKILDMGLARLESAGGQQDQLTGTGQIMGTVDYMAPEQAMDTKSADARADIYSLGVTLWYLLTGRAVYEGDSVVQKLMAHQRNPIPALCSVCPQVSTELEAVFVKMIAKTPEARYQTMTAVIADLERCTGSSVANVAVAIEPPGEDTRLNEFLRGLDAGGPAVAQKSVTKAKVAQPAAAAPTMTMHSPEVDTDPDGLPSVMSERPARSGKRRRPAKSKGPGRNVWIGAGVAAAVLLLAGIVFLVRTKDGYIRVEIEDPQIEVAIKGTDIVLKQADQGKDVTLSPGDHTLVVQRGDFKFETDKFVLKARDKVTVNVELLPGEIKVRQGKKLLGQGKLPSPAKPDAGPAESPAAPVNVAAKPSSTAVPSPGGDAFGTWQQLFDGKTLAGWKTSPQQPGEWSVEDELLTGKWTAKSPLSHLFSERGDFEDFHVRVEVRVNAGGNSGLFFRAGNGLTRNDGRFPEGYEAQILHREPPIKGNTTGSLTKFQSGKDTVIKPDQWVTMEVVALGNHIVISVDGVTTVDFVDAKSQYKRGHFALQLMDPGSVVQFRKIEVRVPSASASTPSSVPPNVVLTNAKSVDLLSLVDLKRDAGVGTWKRVADGVNCENPAGACVLQLPYEPPEEYDFEIEFTASGKGLNVNQYLAANGRMFAWKLNSHNVNPPLYGFEMLDGKHAKDNKEAAIQIPEPINNGQRYRSTVEVRRGSLRTLLDGRELVKWSGDFQRLSMETSTPMPHPGRVGIGSWRRTVTFHSATVREVSGAGKLFASAPTSTGNDLLSKIDVARDGIGKSWSIKDGELQTIAAAGEGDRRLYLPIESTADDYDIRMTVCRVSPRPNACVLGFVTSGHRCAVVMDGFNTRGGLWGLELIEGKNPMDNGTAVPKLPLKVNEPTDVLVQVRKTGIRVERDGKQLIQWTGSADKLSLSAKWDDQGPPRFFIGAQGDFKIQRLTFEPVQP